MAIFFKRHQVILTTIVDNLYCSLFQSVMCEATIRRTRNYFQTMLFSLPFGVNNSLVSFFLCVTFNLQLFSFYLKPGVESKYPPLYPGQLLKTLPPTPRNTYLFFFFFFLFLFLSIELLFIMALFNLHDVHVYWQLLPQLINLKQIVKPEKTTQPPINMTRQYGPVLIILDFLFILDQT